MGSLPFLVFFLLAVINESFVCNAQLVANGTEALNDYTSNVPFHAATQDANNFVIIYANASSSPIKISYWNGYVKSGVYQISQTGVPNNPRVASLNNTHIVGVWKTDAYGVRARICERTGCTQNEFRVDNGSVSTQTFPKVTTLGPSNFVIAWQQTKDVYLRIYRNDGAAITQQFLVTNAATRFDIVSVWNGVEWMWILVYDATGLIYAYNGYVNGTFQYQNLGFLGQYVTAAAAVGHPNNVWGIAFTVSSQIYFRSFYPNFASFSGSGSQSVSYYPTATYAHNYASLTAIPNGNFAVAWDALGSTTWQSFTNILYSNGTRYFPSDVRLNNNTANNHENSIAAGFQGGGPYQYGGFWWDDTGSSYFKISNYVPASPSASPSVSPSTSVTPSITPTASPSVTPSVTPSISLSPSPSSTPSVSATPSISLTPSPSITPSSSPSPSPTSSMTPSVSPSRTPSTSATSSVTPSISVSPSPSISASSSPSSGASSSRTPSISPSNSITPSPSSTPSVTSSTTPSITPSISVSNSPSVTPSITPSSTASITPSITPSVTPSTSPSISPSMSPGASTTPSSTPSVTPSTTPSRTPSVSPSNSIAPTPSSTSSGAAVASTPSVEPSPSNPTASSSPGSDESNKRKASGALIGGVVGGLGGGLTCGVIIFICFVRGRKKSDDQEAQSLELQSSSTPGTPASTYFSITPSPSTPLVGILPAPAKKNDDKGWKIKYEDVLMKEELGRGAFGVVHKCVWRNTDCVIKLLTNTNDNALKAFLREADNVKNLRNHPNVCAILGVCEDPVAIIMEYVPGGSLLNCIANKRIDMSPAKVVKFAKDIASGMSHLHAENIIHLDLACRNLLVAFRQFDDEQIKITDFGLSRIMEAETYTASTDATFPVRWTAPETLSMGIISRASDVWSFGICLWEIIERQMPYLEVPAQKVIQHVLSGARLSRPEKVQIPDSLWALMQDCWQEVPADRPTFDQICSRLKAIEQDAIDMQSDICNQHTQPAPVLPEEPQQPISRISSIEYGNQPPITYASMDQQN